MEFEIKNIIGIVNFLIVGYLFIKKVIKGETLQNKLIKESSENQCFT